MVRKCMSLHASWRFLECRLGSLLVLHLVASRRLVKTKDLMEAEWQSPIPGTSGIQMIWMITKRRSIPILGVKIDFDRNRNVSN